MFATYPDSSDYKSNDYLSRISEVICISNYRGCLVQKTKQGFNIFGQNASSQKEVDNVINKGLLSIQKSIVKQQ